MDLRDQLQQTLGTAYALDRQLSGGGMLRVSGVVAGWFAHRRPGR